MSAVPHAEWVKTMSLGDSATRIGLLLLIEAHDRIHGKEFGELPKPIKQDAWTQGGYCIDAKEAIPAGACRWFQVDAHDGFPEQILLDREGAP